MLIIGSLFLGAAAGLLATGLFVWALLPAVAFIGPVGLGAAVLVGTLLLGLYRHATDPPDEEHLRYQAEHRAPEP